MSVRSTAELFDRAGSLISRGQKDEAIALLRREVERAPNDAELRVLLTDALQTAGETKAALEHLRHAVSLVPQRLDWRCNLAALLGDAGQHEEAVTESRRVLDVDCNCAPALYNQAMSLVALGNGVAARDLMVRCARLTPGDHRVWTTLGSALALDWQFNAAIDCYDRALALAPDYIRALTNRGAAKLRLQLNDSALADFDRVLALEPGSEAARTGRFNLLRGSLRHEEALAAAESWYRQSPDVDAALSAFHLAAQEIAAWEAYEERVAALVARARTGRRVANPHAFLNVVDSPEDQLLSARSVATTFREREALWRGDVYQHERLRVGYLSSDFHNHATAYLMAGLIERHDRARFECFGLSYGAPHDTEQMRERLRIAFEHFEDFGAESPRAIAVRIRALEIDVLVELKGYTSGTRMEVLVHRPAPVQVHYLGYPGTLGADFVDYLIADRIVIPPQADAHYTEQIVRMPHCYQVTDDRRTVDAGPWTRERAALPARGLILCALHQTYKLNPLVFDAWMRLLKRLPDAHLWLLAQHPEVPERLTLEAAARGVDPARLLFAPALPQPEHLARLRLADLFLDTWPVTAHTTASDALWVGLPVVAYQGRSFVTRVSASIVRAAGFPELVAESPEAYEDLVVRLGSNPDELQQLRWRIESQARASPLFDTAGFTRDFETALLQMAFRQKAGLPPAPIDVARAPRD